MSTIFGNFFTSKNDSSSQSKTQPASSNSQSGSILSEAKSLAAATQKGISSMTSSSPPATQPSMNIVSEPSSSSSSGLFSYFTFRNVVILLVVALFLGYNVLSALGSTADDIRYGLQPILGSIANVFGLTLGSFIKTTSDESTKGVVTIAETANKAIDDTVDGAQKVLGGTPVEKDDESDEESEDDDETGEKALDKAIDLAPQKKSVVEADEAGSKTQGKTGKAGWCYIGEDRGFRSCAKVGRQQECESGEYFSRKELCENPDMRE